MPQPEVQTENQRCHRTGSEVRDSRGGGHPAARITKEFTTVPRQSRPRYSSPQGMEFIPQLKHAVSQTSGIPIQYGRVRAKHAFKHEVRQAHGRSTSHKPGRLHASAASTKQEKNNRDNKRTLHQNGSKIIHRPPLLEYRYMYAVVST